MQWDRMARPRKFQEDDVVAAALELFRTHGYAATTMRKIEAATGVGVRSLANTFTDKESLFLRALELYHAAAEAEIATRFAKPGTKALLKHLATFEAEAPFGDPRHQGCLMVNTVFELDALDPRTREAVAAYRGLWQRTYAASLARHGIKKPKQRAAHLQAAISGAWVQVRMTRDFASARPVALQSAAIVKAWRAAA